MGRRSIVIAAERASPANSRVDTPIEIDYYLHGGILPYVLRQLLAGTTGF